ncbi:transketolase family protein [Candidatus Woesearchaeota archaeon]|nr:transketolase family protein [Candidatus Woesearchaeota archaeon]
MKPRPRNLTDAAKKWWLTGKESLQREATRQGFGRGIVAAAKQDERVYALTADLKGSTGLSAFAERYPKRFVDVGVAEQSLAGIAAGMASEGLKPVMASFAVFSPGRNWDFIRTQIAYSRLPVIIVGSHAGLATGEDGATHQALEDVALMRSLPGMTILSPGDGNEAAFLIRAAIKKGKPAYLRLAREKTPQLIKRPALIGKGSWLLEGDDVCIITTGSMAFPALEAAKRLWAKHKKSASVLHAHTIKPLDAAALERAGKHELVITLEDHDVIGGLGSAAAELLARERRAAPLIRLGVNDRFGESGTPGQLYKKHGLDAQGISSAVMRALRE